VPDEKNPAETGAPDPTSAAAKSGSAETAVMEILGYSYPALVELMQSRYGKGEFHADGLMRHLHTAGTLDGLEHHKSFKANPSLAALIQADFSFTLPEVVRTLEDDRVVKFALRLADGHEIEAVLISMTYHNTLCISSQVGCARGCRFCETAKMGLLRNLTTAQVVLAKLLARKPLKNIVFMGMGEPLDNFTAVTDAVTVISEKRGINIPTARMTLSTCGVVPGIRKLVEWMARGSISQERHALRLAVSLNAPTDAVRDKLMPVNRRHNMAELKEVLKGFPAHHREDRLFVEYVLIPGLTASMDDAESLADFLDGLKISLNVIKYNPGRSSEWRAPTTKEVEAFCTAILARGHHYRIRDSRGDNVMAACGQLRTERK
jgi:23S rRNA (adenine2503-C2)-methyltransferase